MENNKERSHDERLWQYKKQLIINLPNIHLLTFGMDGFYCLGESYCYIFGR